MSNPDVLGWLAAGLMVATFGCREAGAMRPLAVATNLAFIGYGLAASLAPVLTLHLLLLPINLWRWAEVLRAKESFVNLMNLLQRLAPALALAACVVLSACGGGGDIEPTPTPTTPPVTLTEIQREWSVWEIRARARRDELLEKADTDQNIAVSLDRELDGGLAFVPPDGLGHRALQRRRHARHWLRQPGHTHLRPEPELGRSHGHGRSARRQAVARGGVLRRRKLRLRPAAADDGRRARRELRHRWVRLPPYRQRQRQPERDRAPGGRIVLAGHAVNTATSFDVALVRFGPNGVPDTSFGNDGAQVFDLFNSADGANDLLLQSDGRLVAAGSARNGLATLPLLLRVIP